MTMLDAGELAEKIQTRFGLGVSGGNEEIDVTDVDLAQHAFFVAEALAVLFCTPHDLMERQSERVMSDGVDQVCIGF